MDMCDQQLWVQPVEKIVEEPMWEENPKGPEVTILVWKDGKMLGMGNRAERHPR